MNIPDDDAPVRGSTARDLLVAGAAVLTLANLLLAAAIATAGGGYLAAIYLPVLWCIAALLLAAAFVLGLVRRAADGDVPAIAVGLVAAATTFVLAAEAFGPLEVPAIGSEWLVTLLTGAGVVAAAALVEPASRRQAAVAVVAVLGSASLISVPLATDLDVTIVSAPDVAYPGATERLLFTASEGGPYDVWLGAACGRGERVASGLYEVGDLAEEVVLSARGAGGVDRVHVCVRNGIASGADVAEIRIDEVAPPAATIDVQPTTGQGADRTAHTRTLELLGSAPADARVVVEINDAGGQIPIDVPVVDGGWRLERTFSSVTDEFSVGVVTEDAAGLTTRGPMLHIDFVGIDAPPLALSEHPGLLVECRGEPDVEADACRAWARDALSTRPDMLAGAVRLLLAQPNQYGSCYMETRNAEGFVAAGVVIACPDPPA